MRPNFVSLGVMLLLGGLLATVGATATQQAKEDAKAAQCKANLKELAIAMHNFNEVHRMLPVFTVSNEDGHGSWALLITPYLEDKKTFESFVLAEPCDSKKNLPVVSGFRGDVWQCPTRRSGETYDFPAEWSTNPLETTFKDMMPTDYVAAHTASAEMWSDKANGMIVNPADSIKTGSTEIPRSAISFASATDGTSNTALLGEKHMKKEWLGKPVGSDGEADGVDSPALFAAFGPGSIRVAGDMTAFGTVVLAPRAEYPGGGEFDPMAPFMFGSWHKDITHFANADGAVRALNNNCEPASLGYYLQRNDGKLPFSK